MTLCSVVDCKNIGNHIFPKDANRRKQWIKALRRKNWQPSNYSRLCAAHFKPEDFYERNSYTGDENKHKVLKKTAVPSIFSFTKVKPENQQRLNRRLERSRRRLCLETAPGPSGIQAENNDLFTSIMSEIPQKRAKTSVKKCRACLANIDDDLCCDIFRAWDPVWLGMGISIAQDLSKLTNVQIDTSDPYSKDICTKCCLRLKDSINFIMTVQNSDQALRQRHRSSIDEKPLWPKPIQVDKNITSNPFNDVSIEVKQEVLTDDEYEMNDTWSEPCEPRLDIKIEPEEITPAIPTSMIEINGPYSMLQSPEKKSKPNGATEYLDELVLADLKEEPMSEDEAQPATEMPKECMLCFKSFKTVKGLKSHVIAVHSYDTVTPPRLDRTNVCATCNISFTTRTDLFVHEACHGPGRKFTCYICDKKFDTYLLLSKHKSKRCTKTGVLPRLKTLDDVRRIARNRGTKTLRLFDMQMPIGRIKHLKIDRDECQKIMSKKDKIENKRGKKVKEENESDEHNKTNEKDVLHNLFNGNVMSVIVNVRMPLDELKPKIENEDNETVKPIHKEIKTEPNDGPVITGEPVRNDKSELSIITTTRRHKRKARQENLVPYPIAVQTVVRPSCKTQPVMTVPRIRVTGNKGALESNQILRKLSQVIKNKDKEPPKKLKHVNKNTQINARDVTKHKMTKIKDNKQSNEKTEIKSKNLILTKKRKLEDLKIKLKRKAKEIHLEEIKLWAKTAQSCELQCKKNIPEEFRLQVFNHFRSLNTGKEKRIFVSTFLERDEHVEKKKFRNKWNLKFKSQCYDICSQCLANTLGVSKTFLQHPERPIYIIRDTNRAITIEKSTPERKSPTSQHIDTTETDPSSVGPDLVLEGVKSGDNGLAHDVQPIEPSTGLNLSDNKELVPNEQYESTETAPEETNSSKDEKKSNMNTLSEENNLQADNTINITCVIDETYRFKTNKRKIKQNNQICQKSINTEVIDSDRCEKENSEQKQNAIFTAYIHEDNVELESKVDITKDNGSEVCSKTKENKSDAGHELDEKLPGVTTIENNTSEDSKVSDNKEKLHQTIAIERDEIEESIQLKVLKNCVNDKLETINSEETDNKKIKQNETKDTETIFNETRDNEIKVCETIGSEPMLHKEQWHEC